MSYKNDPLTIEIYNEICDHYFQLVEQMQPALQALDLKLETVKQEKAIFKPSIRKVKRHGLHKGSISVNVNKDFLIAFEAEVYDQRIEIKVGSYECRFYTSGIPEFKAKFERLITPKHHRFYVTEIKQAAAA